MAKPKANKPSLAAKLLAELQRHARSNVIDLRSAIDGRAMAEELQRTMASPQRLAGMHPSHAAYVCVQNQVSVLMELLTGLNAMAPFADMFAKADDMYMPNGPPMSPLTRSYFTCWAFFDARCGPTDETFGTILLDVGAALGLHGELLRLIRLMQQSRMGVYFHEGKDGNLAILRDLATDAVHRCFVPAGYAGKKGELWYARVLPPPLATDSATGSVSIVFTTPYLLIETPLAEWIAYFQRVLPVASSPERIDAAERHMKYGPSHAYWNEFVFEGYANHRHEAVFLIGLPDMPESRPHSPAYRPRAGQWG